MVCSSLSTFSVRKTLQKLCRILDCKTNDPTFVSPGISAVTGTQLTDVCETCQGIPWKRDRDTFYFKSLCNTLAWKTIMTLSITFTAYYPMCIPLACSGLSLRVCAPFPSLMSHLQLSFILWKQKQWYCSSSNTMCVRHFHLTINSGIRCHNPGHNRHDCREENWMTGNELLGMWMSLGKKLTPCTRYVGWDHNRSSCPNWPSCGL